MLRAPGSCLAVGVSWPVVSVALMQRAGRVWQDAEQQPGRVTHHLPGVHALHAPGTEVLDAAYLGV